MTRALAAAAAALLASLTLARSAAAKDPCADGPPAFAALAGAKPWLGEPSPALHAWANEKLSETLGTVLRDVVDGAPVEARVECHPGYGDVAGKPAGWHKGVSVYRPGPSVVDEANAVEDALVAWTHRSLEALHPWAVAIADVCTGREECIRFAAQAFVEDQLLPWVLDQRCNDAAWRRSQPGWIHKSCDGGLAFGPWQVHDERFRGASPGYQAAVALQLMRDHPYFWTTWRAARSHAAWWIASSAGVTERQGTR